MSRLDRRTGSLSDMYDAVFGFKQSLDNAPRVGVPRVVRASTQCRPGEILICQTASGRTLYARLSPDFQHGQSCRVINDGPGRVDIVCPPGITMLATGLGYYTVPVRGASFEIFRADKDRFSHFPGNSEWVMRQAGSYDFTDGSVLVSDGSQNQLDLSSIVPEYATNGLVAVHTTLSGSGASTESFSVLDGGLSAGGGASQVKTYVTSSGANRAGGNGVVRMMGRSITYVITSTVTTCGLSVVGWKSL